MSKKDNWNAVTSLESNGGYEDVVGQIEATIVGMWNTYGNVQSLSADTITNATASIITQLKESGTQEAFASLSPVELESVKERLTNIPSPLPTPKPTTGLKKKNYEIIETAIVDFQKTCQQTFQRLQGQQLGTETLVQS